MTMDRLRLFYTQNRVYPSGFHLILTTIISMKLANPQSWRTRNHTRTCYDRWHSWHNGEIKPPTHITRFLTLQQWGPLDHCFHQLAVVSSCNLCFWPSKSLDLDPFLLFEFHDMNCVFFISLELCGAWYCICSVDHEFCLP